MEQQIRTTLENLQKNGIEACFVATAAEALAAVKAQLTPGCRVAMGGSVTLAECGVAALLRSGDYDFIDRDEPGIPPEERTRRMQEAFGADVYLCSANAVTEVGELYHVDGLGNRVAAVAYGPAKVLMVVGVNKLVADRTEAIRRVKTVAAPRNTKRLSCETPCAATGRCITMGTERETDMTAGCGSAQRVCCKYLFSGKQRVPGRLQVILCGETLGY